MSFITIFIAILVAYLVLKLVSKVFWVLIKLAAASVLGVGVVTYHAEILTFVQNLIQ